MIVMEVDWGFEKGRYSEREFVKGIDLEVESGYKREESFELEWLLEILREIMMELEMG